jgi:hypothetical protein
MLYYTITLQVIEWIKQLSLMLKTTIEIMYID